MTDWSGSPQTSHDGARDWLAEALAAFARGDAERALYCSREAIGANANSDLAWSIRAQASRALGHLSDAVFEANEAVRLAPTVAGHYDTLASVYEMQERYGDAIVAANRAIELDPEQPGYFATLGSIFLNRGAAAQALPIFEQLHADDPDEPLYRLFLARALYEDAESRMTQVPGGRFGITSPEQIEIARTASNRGLALQFRDDELRADLEQLRAAVERAENKHWKRARGLKWYIGAALVLLYVGFAGIGSGVPVPAVIGLLSFAALAGLIWLYVSRHHLQGWQVDRAMVAEITGKR